MAGGLVGDFLSSGAALLHDIGSGVSQINDTDKAAVQAISGAINNAPFNINNYIQGTAQQGGLAGWGAIGQALYNTGTPQPTAVVQPQSSANPLGPAGPHKASYTPPPTGAPELTYQQAMTRMDQPLINAAANVGGTTLAQGQPGAPASASQNISTTLQTMSSDYKQGLNLLLKTSGNMTPLEAELKGMAELIAYPVAGLTGQQGAPPGVEGIPFLESLYEALNQEREGVAPTTSSASNLAGYNNNNAVQTILSGS